MASAFLNRSVPPADESLGLSATSGVVPVASTSESVREMLVGALADLLVAYNVEPREMVYLSGGEQASTQMLAKIGFTSEQGQRGSLLLGVPPGVIRAMQLDSDGTGYRDWLGELANQFLGRFKNKLLAYGVRLEMGTPFVSSAPVQPIAEIGADAQWFCVGTDFGCTLAAAEGLPSDDALGRQATDGFLSEGDCELF